MSYDLGLKDPVSDDWCYLNTPHFMRGGTFCCSGENTATINITYNYSKIFQKVLNDTDIDETLWDSTFGGRENTGIRMLYGMKGSQSIPFLKAAIEQLGDDVSEDYWEATEGNAKRALLQCLALAEMRPDGVWDGD